MNKTLSHKSDLMDKVTDLLAEHFIEPLYQLSKEKNYYTRVGSTAEIIDWSKEFCEQHQQKFQNREEFQSNEENMDDLIISFGYAKLKSFCLEKKDQPSYFLEKYSAIQL